MLHSSCSLPVPGRRSWESLFLGVEAPQKLVGVPVNATGDLQCPACQGTSSAWQCGNRLSSSPACWRLPDGEHSWSSNGANGIIVVYSFILICWHLTACRAHRQSNFLSFAPLSRSAVWALQREASINGFQPQQWSSLGLQRLGYSLLCACNVRLCQIFLGDDVCLYPLFTMLPCVHTNPHSPHVAYVVAGLRKLLMRAHHNTMLSGAMQPSEVSTSFDCSEQEMSCMSGAVICLGPGMREVCHLCLNMFGRSFASNPLTFAMGC